MKKRYMIPLIFSGLALLAVNAQGAEILNDDAASQAVLAFTPSNEVIVVYECGNNGAASCDTANSDPQQYYSVSKHNGGTRVFITTESANISYVENDDNRGVALTTTAANLVNDADQAITLGDGLLGANVEELNAADWKPL